MSTSGYTDCACRDCFEIAISDDMDHPDLCHECDEAGCSEDGDENCQRDDAYGMGDICLECLCWVNSECANEWHKEHE